MVDCDETSGRLLVCLVVAIAGIIEERKFCVSVVFRNNSGIMLIAEIEICTLEIATALVAQCPYDGLVGRVDVVDRGDVACRDKIVACSLTLVDTVNVVVVPSCGTFQAVS